MNKPMRVMELNPKLQQLCLRIGLLERNTYYSLHRAALIEVRHGKLLTTEYVSLLCFWLDSFFEHVLGPHRDVSWRSECLREERQSA